ncbi:MAG: peptidyl-tRNA hydrolase [Clostridiaceae bacterium BRH_c20a]|nr:MAG: peptidyl-tRNA hydrolase [Clostridiaceae bacterium BRH_c20a]
MFMIVGLGNPGRKYENTRHNVGFWVVDKIAEQLNIKIDKKIAQAQVQTSFWDAKKILLVKPQTYMNLSGQSVMQLINFYQDQVEDFIIVHDDLDLQVGQLRFKVSGGTGGHNGLKSIIQHTNSQEFDRLKIGIGKPEYHDVENYVLTPFTKEEKDAIDLGVKRAVEGIKIWMDSGIEKAMNNFN